MRLLAFALLAACNPFPVDDPGPVDTETDTGDSDTDTGDTDTGDTDTGDPVDTGDTDTDTGADTDTGDPVDTGDTDTGPKIETGEGCERPITYTRIVHTQGAVGLGPVAYAPDGAYALVLAASGAELMRYDATLETLTDVDSATGERWTEVAFAHDGSYALVAGSTTNTSPTPKLYVYTEAGGLVEITGITGIGDGKLAVPSRIGALAQQPASETWGLLSDNAVSPGSQVVYLHTFTPDFSGGQHVWSYDGAAAGTYQGARSLGWGQNLGQPVGIGVTAYVDFIFRDVLADTLTVTQPAGYGNFSEVLFRPDGQVAWIFNWSANGIYTWDGALHRDFGWRLDPDGWTLADADMSPDGHWRIIVGRNGYAWLTDAPFTATPDMNKVYDEPIPGWGSPPYSGADSSDYLNGVAWRPTTCEGLITGDTVQAQGLLVKFALAP